MKVRQIIEDKEMSELAKGYGIRKLARELGKDVGYVSRIVSGKKVASEKLYGRIGKILNGTNEKRVVRLLREEKELERKDIVLGRMKLKHGY